MSDAKDAKGERRISEVPGKEVKGPEERRGNWFREMAQRLGPLVAVLALNCYGSSTERQDADTEEDGAAEVERDVPDVQGEDARPDEGQDDAATPEDVQVDEEEDGAVEESANPDVAEEDVSSTDGEEVPEAVDAPDVAEGTDVPEEEAGPGPDSYDCTETTRTEETVAVLPEQVCGRTQTVRDVDYIVQWAGEDCESTGEASTRMGRALSLAPGVDTAGLSCIRARVTSTPQGEELLVGATETSLETARGIACADMVVGTNLDGGAGEYKFRLTDAREGEVVGTVFDQDWRIVRNIRIYGTGAASSSATRGWIASEFNPSAFTARVCYIELPTHVRNNGDPETWAGYGSFRFNTSVAGADFQGWEWVRE